MANRARSPGLSVDFPTAQSGMVEDSSGAFALPLSELVAVVGLLVILLVAAVVAVLEEVAAVLVEAVVVVETVDLVEAGIRCFAGTLGCDTLSTLPSWSASAFASPPAGDGEPCLARAILLVGAGGGAGAGTLTAARAAGMIAGCVQ
jgi:hypothetical protein